MEGIKNYSEMRHKEKTAKWELTQATAGKNVKEIKSMVLKRMMVLFYDFSFVLPRDSCS